MKTSKPSQIIMLSSIVLGLQASVLAQGNLVNLYDWTPETPYGYSSTQGVGVSSFNSARFQINYATNAFQFGSHQNTIAILTGNIETTPGATYEINFNASVDSHNIFVDNLEVSFGNNSIGVVSLNNLFPDNYLTYTDFFDFTGIATSPTTELTLTFTGDNGSGMNMDDFSVTAVPEPSPGRLFGFGGCALLLVQPCRRLFQKPKPS